MQAFANGHPSISPSLWKCFNNAGTSPPFIWAEREREKAALQQKNKCNDVNVFGRVRFHVNRFLRKKNVILGILQVNIQVKITTVVAVVLQEGIN